MALPEALIPETPEDLPSAGASGAAKRYAVLQKSEFRDELPGSPTEGKIWTGIPGTVLELPASVASRAPEGVLRPALEGERSSPLPAPAGAPGAAPAPAAALPEGLLPEGLIPEEEEPAPGALGDPGEPEPPDLSKLGEAGRARTPDQERVGEFLAFHAKQEGRGDYDPVKTAGVLKVATGNPGVSVQHILDNWDGPDGYKTQLDAETNWELVAAYHPGLARYALEDPARLALVRDDSANLTSLGDLIFGRWDLPSSHPGPLTPEELSTIERQGDLGKTTLPPWAAALRDATKRTKLALIQTARQLALPSGEVEDQRRVREAIARARESGRTVEQEFAALPSPEPAPPSAFVTAAEQRIAELKEETKPKDYGAFARSTVGKFVMGAAEFAPAVAGATLASAALGPAGGIAWWTAQTYGPLAAEAEELRGPNGEKLTSDEVRERTFLPALAGSAGLEVGLGGLVGRLGAAALKREVAQRSAAMVLASPTFAELVGKNLGHASKDVATGTLAMGIQNLANRAAIEYARASLDPANPVDTEKIVHEAVESLPESLYGLVPFALLGAGRQLLRDNGQRLRAKAEAAQLRAMGSAIEASKVFKTSPEEAAKIVSALKEQAGLGADAPVDTVFATLPEFQRYWQEQKVDPREAAAEILGEGGAQIYDQAALQQTDLAIPLERAAALITAANGEHWKALLPDLKLSRDGSTPRQEQVELERRQAVTKELAAVEPDEMEADHRAVYDAFRDQAIESGRSEKEASAAAVIYAAGMKTLGQHFGVTAWDVWEAHPLNIEGPNTEAKLAHAHKKEALEDYDQIPAAKARRFLETGEGEGPLAELAAQARERAAAQGGAELPPELSKKIERVQKAIAKLEGKATGAGETAGPFERPSPTKKARVAIRSDEEGGTSFELHEGEIPAGAEVREVKLPSWLDQHDFVEARTAWEWTWSALADGPAAPEHVQKLVHGYMAKALAEFPVSEFGLKQGWAAGRLASGKGGRRYFGLQDRIAEWAKEPEGSRAADPIPEAAWGGLIDTTSKDTKYVSSGKFENKKRVPVLEKWLALTKAELDPDRPTYRERPPSWYAKPGEGEAAPVGGEAAPAGAGEPAGGAKLAALRSQLEGLNAEAAQAARAGAKVRPKLDFDVAARVLGTESTKIPTERGGIHPDELAKALGVESGDRLLRDMAALPGREAWARNEALERTVRRARPRLEQAYYHGTPATWSPEPGAPLGQFRRALKLTGEGGAYKGAGAYVAEAPETGENYRLGLSKPEVDVGGKLPAEHAEQFKDYAQRAVLAGYSTPAEVLNYVRSFARGEGKRGLAEALGSIKPEDVNITGNTGSLYKLNFPDELLPKVLDFDKPIAEQSPEVKEALKKLPLEARRPLMHDGVVDFDGKAAAEHLAKKSKLRPGEYEVKPSPDTKGFFRVYPKMDVVLSKLDRMGEITRELDARTAALAAGDVSDPAHVARANLAQLGNARDAIRHLTELAQQSPEHAKLATDAIALIRDGKVEAADAYAGKSKLEKEYAALKSAVGFDERATGEDLYHSLETTFASRPKPELLDLVRVLRDKGLAKDVTSVWRGTDTVDSFARRMLEEYGTKLDKDERALFESANENPAERASQTLADLGIPAHQFFDEVSRADRKGTRNMVVYEPDKHLSTIARATSLAEARRLDRLWQASFHGTHAQGIERFELKKVGSGTGIAAEGFGLYSSSLRDIADMYRERLAAQKPFEGGAHAGEGQVYALDVPENYEILALREPVSKQVPEVRAMLEKAGLAGDPTQTGKELYKALEKRWTGGDPALRATGAGRADEAAARFLLGFGIKGARYPAEIAPGGVRGTNFVTWDEAAIKILKEQGAPQVRLYQRERAEPRPAVWYSPLEKGIASAKQAKGTAESWLAVLVKTPGVKAEELAVTGLRGWLERVRDAAKLPGDERAKELKALDVADPKGTVTRDEVAKVAQANRIQVKEKILGEEPEDTSGVPEQLHAKGAGLLAKEGWTVDTPGMIPLFARSESPELHGSATDWRRDADHILPRKPGQKLRSDDPRLPSKRAQEVMDVLESAHAGDPLDVRTVDGKPLLPALDPEDLHAWIAADAIDNVRSRTDTRPGPKYLQAEARKRLEDELHEARVRSGIVEPFVAAKTTDARGDEGWAAYDERTPGQRTRRSGVYGTEAEARGEAADLTKQYLERIGERDRANFAARAAAVEKALEILPTIDASKVEPWNPLRTAPTEYEGYAVGGHVPGSYRELLLYAPGKIPYTAPHFGEGEHGQGLLAHARVSEHVGADGKRALLIEEIQSDLHQAGRERGYVDRRQFEADKEIVNTWAKEQGIRPRTGWEQAGGDMNLPNVSALDLVDKAPPEVIAAFERVDAASRSQGVPDAPWKQGWEELATKRVLHYAAEHGYDQVALTPGDVHAQRWGSELVAWQKGPMTEGAPELTVPWEQARTKVVEAIESWREQTKDQHGTRIETARGVYERVIADVRDAYDAGELRQALRSHLWPNADHTLPELVRMLDRTDLEGRGLGDMVAQRPVQGYHVTAKEQHRGEAGGMHLEDAAMARGLVKQGRPELVASESDLAALIGAQIQSWSKEKAEATAKKLWPRVQAEEAGAHMPRAEGFALAYDKRIRGALEKQLKRFGGKVAEGRLEGAGGEEVDARADQIFGEIPLDEVKQRLGARLDARVAELGAAGGTGPYRDVQLAAREVAAAETRFDVFAAVKERGEGSDKRTTFENLRRGLEDLGVPWEGLLEDPRQRVHMGELPESARERILQEGMPLFQDEKTGGKVSAKLTLEPADKDGKPRGYFEFEPIVPGEPVRMRIQILAGDKSTLAHESFHALSLVMGHLAEDVSAPAELRADYQKLLDAMGYKDHAERAGAPDAAKEERATHLWEAYLAEGKAPSEALAPAFARFKTWLTKLYKGFAGIRDQFKASFPDELFPELSDEVKGVFDRLLASRDEIEKVRKELDPKPPADLEAMTPAERTAYDKQDDLEREDGERDLVRRAAEDDRRELVQHARELGEAIRGDVEKYVANGDPGMKALAFLSTGKLPGIEDLGEAYKGADGQPLKLSRPKTVDLIGATDTAALPSEIFARARKGGVSADELAPRLGFETGEELLDAIRGKDWKKAVEEEITNRVGEDYGPALLDDPSRVEGAAREALRTEAGAKKLSARLEAITRQLDPSFARRLKGMTVQARRQIADRDLADKPIRSLSIDQYSNLEKMAHDRATRAWEQGKKEAAWDAVDAALWNHIYGRAARDLREKVDGALALMKQTARPAWRSEVGKAGQVYLTGHDAILAALGVGQGPADGRSPLEAIQGLLARMVKDGDATLEEQLEPDVAGNAPRYDTGAWDVDTLLDLLRNPLPQSERTATEVLNARDAVKDIRGLANRQNDTILGKRRLAREAIIDEAVETASRNLPAQPKSPRDPLLAQASMTRAARLTGQGFAALIMDMETAVHALDGGDREGIFHQIFIDQWRTARDKRDELTRRFVEYITDQFEKSGIERQRLYELIDPSQDLPLPPELARMWEGDGRLKEGKVTRSNLLMMALNLGNASNEERFLGGYQWKREKVIGFLQKHLNANEWRWVQDVWDGLEKGGAKESQLSLYDEMANMHMEDRGLPLEKIKRTPFTVTTSDGETVELQGGYFPARYDPRPGTSRRTGEKQVARDVADFVSGMTTGTPSVRAPHAKKRAVHFEDALNLNWGIVPQHVAQVIQDIAFRRYVKQTAGLLLNDRMNLLLVERLGEEKAKTFRPWLLDVANARSTTLAEGVGKVDRFWAGLKSRASIAAIGWSIPTALTNLTDPLVSAAGLLVRPDTLARVAARQAKEFGEATMNHVGSWVGKTDLKDPTNTTLSFALEHSGEVRARLENASAEYRRKMGEMGGREGMKHPVLRAISNSAWFAMEAIDHLVIPPMWTGAYQDAMAKYKREGFSPDEAHAKAVRAGDDTLSQSLPPQDVAEKPPLLRDPRGLGALVLFYGHANKMWGLFYARPASEVARAFREGEGRAAAVAKFAGRIMAMAVVNGAIAEGLAGRGQEDDETRGEWWERKLIAALFYPLPFIGSAGDWVASKLVTGSAKKLSLRGSPVLSFAQQSIEKIGHDVEAWQDGDLDRGKAALMSAEFLLTLGVGAPTRQASRTLGYWHDLATGEARARGPFDFAAGSIYGEKDSGAGNPLTDLQDVVSGRR